MNLYPQTGFQKLKPCCRVVSGLQWTWHRDCSLNANLLECAWSWQKKTIYIWFWNWQSSSHFIWTGWLNGYFSDWVMEAWNLPISYIKTDKSFTQYILSEKTSRYIVESYYRADRKNGYWFGCRRCGNTGAVELFVLSGSGLSAGGISAGRKMWIHFVVNMNNSGGVISKLLLKNKNKHI